MRFDEVWSGPEQVEKTAQLAVSTSHRPGAVIEIGAWQGLTSVALANAIYPDLLHVVDHWQGSEEMTQEQRSRDNFSVFIDNMAEATEGNFTVHKQDWREFAETWNWPVRFLHIDAGHGADEVSATISAFLPFMGPGTIMAGDDWDWQSVREGFVEVLAADSVNTFQNKLWWVSF